MNEKYIFDIWCIPILHNLNFLINIYNTTCNYTVCVTQPLNRNLETFNAI